jgi:hypothetical protein
MVAAYVSATARNWDNSRSSARAHRKTERSKSHRCPCRKLTLGCIGGVGNNKQVHGGDVRCVVTQEGAPSLGGRSTSLDHVLRDARLSDLETELEQLTMDARRSLQRILALGRRASHAGRGRSSIGPQGSRRGGQCRGLLRYYHQEAA